MLLSLTQQFASSTTGQLSKGARGRLLVTWAINRAEKWLTSQMALIIRRHDAGVEGHITITVLHTLHG